MGQRRGQSKLVGVFIWFVLRVIGVVGVLASIVFLSQIILVGTVIDRFPCGNMDAQIVLEIDPNNLFKHKQDIMLDDGIVPRDVVSSGKDGFVYEEIISVDSCKRDGEATLVTFTARVSGVDQKFQVSTKDGIPKAASE